MDQNFNKTIIDANNLSVIRQSFANTVFTHKVQEVAAERQRKNVFKIKITNIIFVSIVLVLLFLQASNPKNILFSYSAVGVTIAEVLFLLVQLSFSFEQQAILHKSTALKYMDLRDCYRILIADIMNHDISPETLITRRNLLQKEYQIISDLAPQTKKYDYEEAQKRLNKKGIVEGEEFTWSDVEIDRFLPETLRLIRSESELSKS